MSRKVTAEFLQTLVDAIQSDSRDDHDWARNQLLKLPKSDAVLAALALTDFSRYKGMTIARVLGI